MARRCRAGPFPVRTPLPEDDGKDDGANEEEEDEGADDVEELPFVGLGLWLLRTCRASLRMTTFPVDARAIGSLWTGSTKGSPSPGA